MVSKWTDGQQEEEETIDKQQIGTQVNEKSFGVHLMEIHQNGTNRHLGISIGSILAIVLLAGVCGIIYKLYKKRGRNTYSNPRQSHYHMERRGRKRQKDEEEEEEELERSPVRSSRSNRNGTASPPSELPNISRCETSRSYRHSPEPK